MKSKTENKSRKVQGLVSFTFSPSAVTLWEKETFQDEAVVYFYFFYLFYDRYGEDASIFLYCSFPQNLRKLKN